MIHYSPSYFKYKSMLVPGNAINANFTSYRELGLVERIRDHMYDFTRNCKGFQHS